MKLKSFGGRELLLSGSQDIITCNIYAETIDHELLPRIAANPDGLGIICIDIQP